MARRRAPGTDILPYPSDSPPVIETCPALRSTIGSNGSHVAFEIMTAYMNRRWPDDPRAVGKRVFNCRGKTKEAKVTEGRKECSFVRWRTELGA
jgi:hypothetical protein